jgi:dipeptidyl aminopeptidase/acylaminoacyl peptidase
LGGGDLKDFKAVLQHFIDQGLVDKNKIGITGGSFGYLSYMALTKMLIFCCRSSMFWNG